MDGKWLSIDDISGQYSNSAQALRGLIPLSSTLNGTAFPLHVHKYGRTYTSSTVLFDFSSDAVNRSYSAGDVVTGEIEFIMPPQHSDNYWGSDAELSRSAQFEHTIGVTKNGCEVFTQIN